MSDMPLDDVGVAMNMWFRSLINGGFTEDQALRIIAYSIASTNRRDDA